MYFRQSRPNIHRTFQPTATRYTFFSYAHGTFSRIDCTKAPKKPDEVNKIENWSCISANHNSMKL